MNWKQPKVYAVKHKDEKIRANSRSGGIFTALSDWVLNHHGVVYGCILKEDFQAVHTRADCAEKRNLMRGSKYIQSKIGNTFQNINTDLLTGTNVLFSGTSCQVAGLKKYLGKNYNNLICLDIICHGVPSPKVWTEFLKWNETKHHAKIKNVNFRNKTDFGWRDHVETLTFSSGKCVDSEIFKNLFYEHSILRPCCYQCPYKSIMHPGDLTIADYWGIEKAAPEFDDNRGVSLVLVNNDTGAQLFNLVKNAVEWKETRIKDSMQPPLKMPYPRPDTREEFWNDFFNKSFDYIAMKYGQADRTSQLKYRLKKIRRKLVDR